MGQSAQEKVVYKNAQLQQLLKQGKNQINAFKDSIAKQVENRKCNSKSQDIRILSNSSEAITKELEFFLKKQDWGDTGMVIKKSIQTIISFFVGKAEGEVNQRNGTYIYCSGTGALNEIYWYVKQKVVSGKSWGKTENQLTLIYYYSCHVLKLEDPTISQIKSLIGGTSLTKEEKKQAVKALVCDYLDKCEKN